MSELRFTCAYIAAKDVEETSPCGRPAMRREQGDARCLGHYAIEWLVRVYGRGTPQRTKSVYGYFFIVGLGVLLGGLIQSVTEIIKGTSPGVALIEATLYISLAGMFGGAALGFTTEHPLGGRLWLVSVPVSAVALILDGRSYLLGAVPSSGTRLTEIVHAFACFLIALFWISVWSIFLAQATGRYRLASCLSIFGDVLIVTVVVAGIGLVIVSGGTDNSLLLMLLIAFGVAISVGGIAHLKNLAMKIRV